jgi:hypothetical protein
LENAYVTPDPEKGIPTIVNSFVMALENYSLPNTEKFRENINLNDYANVFGFALRNYCRRLDKPLIIFFDEADCLSESTLLSFLRQLRNGFVNRSIAPFPISVALVGMRNIRDYKAKIRENKETLGTTSPFNIIAESLNLRNFTKKEVAALYKQHTDKTGQLFAESAVELAFEQTQGQPWLINAIAREIIMEQLKKDYSVIITAEMVAEAINTIILRRDVHIDQLIDKLKESRVQKVIEQMIMGEGGNIDTLSDDYNYVKDLGLIRENGKNIEPANPIYAEVIVRMLNINEQSVERGIEQIAGYMDKLGCAEGWLVAFDRNEEKSWDEKIYQKTETVDGKTVNVFGC